jgi:metacaspase-1
MTQLTSSNAMDVNLPFDLVPKEATGTRRALMIGINYTGHAQGQLSGCHNDVRNMKEYIKDVHGFKEENITVLLDDEGYTQPTRENMLQAYRNLVASAEPGDALFCHYSGHGGKIRDDELREESDNCDETLVPLDYQTEGQIRDDDLYDTLVKPLPESVHLVCLMDCCHSGTVLDLPYIYKADGKFDAMEIDEGFDFKKLVGKFGSMAKNFLDDD